MEKLVNLRDLLIEEIQSLYDSEDQMVQALEDVIKATSSKQMKNVLSDHKTIHEKQIKRLEKVFNDFEEPPRNKSNNVMHLLVNEMRNFEERTADPEIMDTGLILLLQQMNHYKIACYGTLSSYARALGHELASSLLHIALIEEKEMDENLTKLAEGSINVKAKNPVIGMS